MEDTQVDLKYAYSYMLAGYSEFTIKSLNTGAELTFKLVKKPRGFGDIVYSMYIINDIFLEDLAGAIYLADAFKKIGFNRGEGLLKPDSVEVRSILFVLNKLRENKLNINVEIRSDGRCGRCEAHMDTADITYGICRKCREKKTP